MMSQSQYSHLNQELAHSVDLFLMRDFGKCFDLCKDIIAVAKNEPEQERNEEVIEAASALGIQALAESDSWDQSFSFVNEVYGAIDYCPPRIIQVCLLLHAHIQEYLLCHKLFKLWLRNPNNLNHKMCSQVIRIYAQHVLCPTESLGTLEQILENCQSVSQETKSSLLEQVMSQIDTSRQTDAQQDRRRSLRESLSSCDEVLACVDDRLRLSAAPCSGDDADTDTDDVDGEGAEDSAEAEALTDHVVYSPVQNTLMSLFDKMCDFLKTRIKLFQNKHVQLVLMAVVAVLALLHSQTGDPVSSLGRLVVIWRVFLHRIGLTSHQ